MLVISNNLRGKIPIPRDAVIRVNVAWLRNKRELKNVIESNRARIIFLDFPNGRLKPPRPKLKFNDILLVMKKYKKINFFAVSNAGDPAHVARIRKVIPGYVKLVPKIETIRGVNNIKELFRESQSDVFMLDKEDLYLSVSADTNLYNKLVTRTRNSCRKLNITLLELQGVIFEKR